ncbi:hypothetical protein TRFO_37932 [Tritrichomonas foetus]|uniref:Uncharacterized protein n=1 Tax=Tritrichomonas foetus TaxID=1144522 RepID=A0A1J4J9R6_9EUKA|nr:hypothetical protein TRFO_37932 [Tritrichomonas foetus]|eukprot:OHS95938.1 hypothetical protein TRFO_37932 [Tritrichomonas foetus]
MKGAATQDPMAGINAAIAQIKETETMAREENAHIKQLIAIQDALIQKQRQILLDVAKTSSELLAVEIQRSQLKQKLGSQKSKLLVSSSESSEVNSLIEQTLSQPDSQPPISSGASGAAALKAIELIQQNLFAVTESCLKTEDLSAPAESLQSLIIDVNEIIQQTLKSGVAKETTEDTVRRQSFVISALVPPPPEDEQ